MSALIARRARAVLHLKKRMTLLVLTVARAIYAAMFALPERFPSPVPALALFLEQIETLETAQQAVSSGSRGVATAVRNTARNAVWISLQSLMAYVQAIADAHLADAIEIILSAAFDVWAPYPPLHKPLLAALMTMIAGQVKLVANAAMLTGGSKKQVTYYWEYSLDGGATWIPARSTPTATTTLGGFALLTTPSFRVCVLLGDEMRPWSDPITILVVPPA